MVAEAAFCAFAVLTLVVLPRAREAGQIGAEFDILGFWPACDHLTKICKTLYGEGTAQFTKSFERWRRELRESRVSEVISELEELHDSGSYPG